MRVVRLLLAAFLMMILLLSVGCGSGTETSGESNKPVIRQVDLADDKITPDKMTVMVHMPVRFVVTNSGNVTHEFRILTEPSESVVVAPKSKEWLDVTFEKAGNFEFIDEVAGGSHSKLKGEIEVEANE